MLGFPSGPANPDAPMTVPTSPGVPEGEPPRHRLRFEELTHHTDPDGRCRITVVLEWRGHSSQGVIDTLETHQGRVRGSAEAALAAAQAVAGDRVRLALVGVKAVKAFDGWVLVVSVMADADGKSVRLLGASSTEEEAGLERASVQAVLNATNRLLEPTLSAIPESELDG